MYDLFNDLDDFFELGFGVPKSLKFNTGKTKDMNPAYWQPLVEDGENIGYKCECRTVGIAEKDVKVSVKGNYIVVEGETEYEGSKYNTHFEMPVVENIMREIKSIDYKTINGLTYIYIKVNKPEKKAIKINKI